MGFGLDERARFGFSYYNKSEFSYFLVRNLGSALRARTQLISSMKHQAIISRHEALQILRNELRKAALQKHADELANATAKTRQRIMSQIDQEIEAEMRRQSRGRFGWPF